MPAPPRPKAELRKGKALPTAPRALLPLALGAVGRALPSLSSSFGRGGVGILDFLKILASFAL